MSITPMSRNPAGRPDRLASTLSASYAGIIAFITVANEGNFSRAAHRLGIGRSTVSRNVQKLEDQLGARLFRRTTRATSITREGELFYENCRPGMERILRALDDMRDLREGPPRGQLRISAPHGFGRKVIAPLIAEFRACYPEVTLEMLLDERTMDLVNDGVDVAFRDGRLEDSRVIAKLLIPMRMHVCASPEYASRHGLPRSVDELAAHACINQRLANGRLQVWDFRVDGESRCITPGADIIVNDPSLAIDATLNSHGLAQLPAYQAHEALREGCLVECLADFAPRDRGHYLCYLSRQQLPKRVRAFIDFMTARTRTLDFDFDAPAIGIRPPSEALATRTLAIGLVA